VPGGVQGSPIDEGGEDFLVKGTSAVVKRGVTRGTVGSCTKMVSLKRTHAKLGEEQASTIESPPPPVAENAETEHEAAQVLRGASTMPPTAPARHLGGGA